MNNWSAPWALDLNNSDFLQSVTDATDLQGQLDAPGWGIALGSKLGHWDAPLNANVPYLYYTGGLSGEVSYGGLSASAGARLKIAFDPADPMLYVDAGGVVQVGVSAGGFLPFTPRPSPRGSPARSSATTTPRRP